MSTHRTNIASETSKSVNTQIRLSKAAAARFAKQGFHATKISDIVADLGVTQPTFYSYFASKKVAYDKLVLQFRTQLKEVTDNVVIKPSKDIHELLEQVTSSFRSFLTFFANNPDLTEIGFRQQPTATKTHQLFIEWLLDNMQIERTSGIVSQEVPSDIIVRSFVGTLDQVSKMHSPEIELQAQWCAKLVCHGVWRVSV